MTSQRKVDALVEVYRAKMGIGVETGPVSRERAALLNHDLPIVRRIEESAESLPPGRVRSDILDLARGLEERWTAELEHADTPGELTTADYWNTAPAHVDYDNGPHAWSWQRRRGKLEYS